METVETWKSTPKSGLCINLTFWHLASIAPPTSTPTLTPTTSSHTDTLSHTHTHTHTPSRAATQSQAPKWGVVQECGGHKVLSGNRFWLGLSSHPRAKSNTSCSGYKNGYSFSLSLFLALILVLAAIACSISRFCSTTKELAFLSPMPKVFPLNSTPSIHNLHWVDIRHHYTACRGLIGYMQAVYEGGALQTSKKCYKHN